MGSKKKRTTRKDAKKSSAQPKVIPNPIPKPNQSDQKLLDDLYLEVNYLGFRVDQARRIFEDVKCLFVPDGNRPNLMVNRLKLRVMMRKFQYEKPPRLVLPDTDIVVTREMVFTLRNQLKMCLYEMANKGGDFALRISECIETSAYNGWCVDDLPLYQELQFILVTMFTGIINFQGTTLQKEFPMEDIWKRCLAFFGAKHPNIKSALAVTKYIVMALGETLILSATSLDRRATVYCPVSTDGPEFTDFLMSLFACASSSSMMGCTKPAKLSD